MTQYSVMSTKTSVGRPRTFDHERVLDEALELFWRKGFRSTTTRELESVLGLSQSSLYNAFGSKQGLMEAALDRYEARITDELILPLETSDAGLASIDVFFQQLGHWVTHEGSRGCMLINLMAEDGGETDAIRARTRRYRNRVRRAIRASLDRAIRLGETADEAVDMRTEALMGMVLALNIAARGGASAAEMKKLIGAARYQIESWRLSA